MAQRIKHGIILATDPSTGTLFPWLQRTLARLVIFPDGRDLWDHWQEEMTEVNKAKFRREQTHLGDNTFNWETNVFGTSNAVLKLHVVMALPTQPGNNKYVYRITLPEQYVPATQEVDYAGACFNVTERENSTFMRRRCLHNVYTDVINNSELRVTVEHFKNIDGVNLDGESYITGGFDIVCNLGFEAHRIPGIIS